MKKIFQSLYTISVIILSVTVLGLTAFFLNFPIALFTGKWPQKGKVGRAGQWARKAWAHSILWAHSVKVEVSGPGLESLKTLKSAVVVSNHQSALDIMVHIKVLPLPMFFFAKKELLAIPIFGWGTWMSGAVYIDRKKGSKDQAAMNAAERVIKRDNFLVVYPEGTRSADGKLRAFKRGGFVFAIQSGAVILPVSISGTSKLWPKSSFRLQSGVVKVHIDEPVPTTSMTLEDRFALADGVRDKIAKNLDSMA